MVKLIHPYGHNIGHLIKWKYGKEEKRLEGRVSNEQLHGYDCQSKPKICFGQRFSRNKPLGVGVRIYLINNNGNDRNRE